MISHDVIPEIITEQHVEVLTGVETIDVRDQIERISSHGLPLFNNLLCGEIVVNEVVVLGTVSGKDFPVNLVEGLTLGSSFKNVGQVAGQVVLAKINTDTIEVVVEIVELHSHGVSLFAHNLVDHGSVHGSEGDQVRAGRDDSVEPVQDSQNILSKVFRVGSRAEAKIIGSELHNDQQRLISSLVSAKKLSVVVSTTTGSATDGEVLVITEVASVLFQQVLVNTVDGSVVSFVGVTSVSTELRVTALIHPSGDDVGESGLIPVSGGGKFVGDLSKDTSRVTDNNDTQFVSVSAQDFLPVLTGFGVLSRDTIAVIINSLSGIRISASSGMDLGIKIVAITSSPVSSSCQSHGSSIVVTIVIHKGNLGVSDLLQVLKELDQRVGASDGSKGSKKVLVDVLRPVGRKSDGSLIHVGPESTLGRFLASTGHSADLITRFSDGQGMDDTRTSDLDDVVTGSLDFIREKAAEFVHNEIIDADRVDVSILFTHADKNGADSTGSSVAVLVIGILEEAKELSFSEMLISCEGHAGKGACHKAEESQKVSH